MKWNDQSGYIKYQNALTGIKTALGISQIDYYLEEILAPYITYTLDYINTRLIMMGESRLQDKVEEISTIFEEGKDQICNGAVYDLARCLKISTTKFDDPEKDEIPFDSDRFIFTWTNVLSALCTRLKLQYANLFAEPKGDGECCRCGRGGDDTAAYESWTSGVWPDDEQYDRTILSKSTYWRPDVEEGIDCRCLRKTNN